MLLSPGSDGGLRPYAEALTKSMGAPFLVDFKPGGGTRIGTNYVAKAKPDGYTLGYVSDGFTVSIVLDGGLPYGPVKEIEPVSLMTCWASVLVTSPTLPVKNARELFAYAKANLGKLNWTAAGPGSTNHMTGTWITNLAGVEVTFVQYKGTSQALIAMTAGRVNVATSRGYNVLPFVTVGKLRALGVRSPTRYKLLPEMPTLRESGLNYDGSTWVGIAATGGTPPAIVSCLSAELAVIAKSPENIRKKEDEGGTPVGSTPQEFKRHIANEVAKWKLLVEKYDIHLEEQ